MSFGNQNPIPIRPSGQVSCFQVAETPHAYLFTLEVPKAVIDFIRSLYRGVHHVKTYLATSAQGEIECESRKITMARTSEKRLKETLRQGRILASSLRRQRRTHGLSRNEALSNLADEYRLPVKQTETFIKLYTRRRDDRIEQSRIAIARRCHAQGMSLSGIGDRLNVSKSTAHRIMERIGEMEDV